MSGHKHVPHRRCHWYENDGTPVQKGCRHSNCHFIHPDDPNWATARRTRGDDKDRDGYRPTSDLLSRRREVSREYDREKERDRDWRREREADRRPRTPSSGPTTSASPSKDTRAPRASASTSSIGPSNATSSNGIRLGDRSPQKSASASALVSRGGATEAGVTSTASHVSSSSLSRNTTAPIYPTRSRSSSLSLDRGSRRERDRSPYNAPDTRSQDPRHRQNSITSSTTAQSPSLKHSASPAVATSMPPPPPALKLTSPQPSTPIPPTIAPAQHHSADKKPIVTSDEVSPSLTRQNKIQIWVDRIKQLSDAVQIRTQHLALERELVKLKALLSSRKDASVSDNVLGKLQKQVDITEKQFAAKQLELNSTVYKLVDSEFWDANISWPRFKGDIPSSDPKGKGRERDPTWHDPNSKDAKAEESFKDLRALVWGVRDGVDELYKMMAELRGTSETSEPRSTTQPQTDDPMVVDAQVPAPIVPATTLESSSSSRPLPMKPKSISRELEQINERLEAIDDKVADLENMMVQFDSNALVALEDRLEERLQELHFSRTDNPERMMIDGEPLDTGQDLIGRTKLVEERLQSIEKEIERGGRDIEGMANEIADIIVKAQATDDEVTRLKKENGEMKSRIEVLEQQNRENAETMKMFKAEMEALNAALQMFISRPASPPPAPPSIPEPPLVDDMPDLQTIIDTIGPLVLGSVREDIVPMLEELKESVQVMMTKQNTQLAQNVMNKLQLTFKTVEVIYAWMNRTVASQMLPPPAPVGVPPTATVPRFNGIHGATSGTHAGVTPLPGGAGRPVTPVFTIHNGVPPPASQTPHFPPTKPMTQ